MRTRYVIPACFITFLFSCQYEAAERVDSDPDTVPEGDPGSSDDVSLGIASLAFTRTSPLVLKVDEELSLSLVAVLSDGRVANYVTRTLAVDDLSGDVHWFMQSSDKLSLSQDGVVRAEKAGQTRVLATVLGHTASIEVLIEESKAPASTDAETDSPPQEEEEDGLEEDDLEEDDLVHEEEKPIEDLPPDEEIATTSYLGDDDIMAFVPGENAGYNEYLYPQVLYGMPTTSGMDVLAFGAGGSLLIELHGDLVVDAPGPDFAIFGNPIAWFAERAQVSVGMAADELVAFPCDAFDEDGDGEYDGCAGLASAYEGGDPFDLADLGISEARFIFIEDMDTCRPGDVTYTGSAPLCAAIGKEGFDLDAIAIVHGLPEN